MKKSFLLYIGAILILFSSCSPSISTQLYRSYPTLGYKEEVKVIGFHQKINSEHEVLGKIDIGDSGFTTKGSYEEVIEKAKLEARKIGGNAIKINEHKTPDFRSTCHRIKAYILRVKDINNLDIEEEKEVIEDVDYAILHVYRYSGAGSLINYDLHLGDTVICRVKNNFKRTIKIKKDGFNSLWAKTEAKAEVPVKLEFGRHYYLKCSLGMGILVGRPILEMVDWKNGKAEFESFNAKKR